jgi:hypothetical protein
MNRRKRSYRAIDVKRLDQAKLAKDVAGKHIVFAVDKAKHKDQPGGAGTKEIGCAGTATPAPPGAVSR